MDLQIMLAGFGGQGILFAGKVLAYCAMTDGKQITWLPSYGPEMRGGTANCSVCISDEEIGSPVIENPDVLIVMNSPSFVKFAGRVKSGGTVIADSSVIKENCERCDIKYCPIPAADIADEEGLTGGANMILLGKFLSEYGIFSDDTVQAALEKCVSPKRANLIPHNLRAIKIGKDK